MLWRRKGGRRDVVERVIEWVVTRGAGGGGGGGGGRR